MADVDSDTKNESNDEEEDSIEKIAADVFEVFKENPDLAGYDDPKIEARRWRLIKKEVEARRARQLATEREKVKIT